MSGQTTGAAFAPRIENAAAVGRIVLVCEHASPVIPAEWGDLGLTADQRRAHIAWDPGALAVARGLMRCLDAVLVHAPVSRLVYDCNRAPDRPGAMPVRSEVHDIPGNLGLTSAQRLRRVEAVYLPWIAGLHGVIAGRIALGLRPVVVTVHSFTPVYFGVKRTVEFGVIHDADTAFSRAIHAAARGMGLVFELNAPYSAADDVTHTLRMQATPYGLPNAMLEIRNDLIGTEGDCAAMAETLAPVINMGLVEIQRQAKAG